MSGRPTAEWRAKRRDVSTISSGRDHRPCPHGRDMANGSHVTIRALLAVCHAVALPISGLLPRDPRTNVVNQEPHALVVGRIQPEHAVEDSVSLLEPAKTPEAQSEPLHAAEKRSVSIHPPAAPAKPSPRDDSPIRTPTS